MTEIIAEYFTFNKENRIKLIFRYNEELIKKVKQIPDREWSVSKRFWHVPDNEVSHRQLSIIGVKFTNERKKKINLSQSVLESLIEFKRYLTINRYSENTIKNYCEAIRKFFTFYCDKELENITTKDIHDYIFYITISGGSASQQNIFISAFKLLYDKVKNTKIDISRVERPRKSRPLPKVIAKENVEKLLSSIINIKHKTALSIIYALGLRRKELINLELTDIDSKRLLIHIRNAKGNKDRTLPLSMNILDLLIKYYKACKPERYLIEGIKKGTKYSETSLQEVFKKSMNRIIPNHNYTLHCLRHSYATHLHEGGTDIRYIQELLGHKSSRTTEIYTHVSTRSLRNISNPFDDFNI